MIRFALVLMAALGFSHPAEPDLRGTCDCGGDVGYFGEPASSTWHDATDEVVQLGMRMRTAQLSDQDWKTLSAREDICKQHVSFRGDSVTLPGPDGNPKRYFKPTAVYDSGYEDCPTIERQFQEETERRRSRG